MELARSLARSLAPDLGAPGERRREHSDLVTVAGAGANMYAKELFFFNNICQKVAAVITIPETIGTAHLPRLPHTHSVLPRTALRLCFPPPAYSLRPAQLPGEGKGGGCRC